MDPGLRSARAKFVSGDLDGAAVEARAVCREAKLCRDAAVVGRARTLLAEIAYDRLRYAEARDQLTQALLELAAALPLDDLHVRYARAALSVVLSSLDDLAGAAEALEAAERGLGEPGAPLGPEEATCWITIAVAHEGVRGMARGRAILEQVISGLELAGDEAVTVVATAHLHLGTVLEMGGERSEALMHLERCVELRVRAFGPENVRVAAARFGVARFLLTTGDLARARRESAEAMATLRALGADRDPRSSTAHATLGVVELLSDNLEAGAAHLETACTIEEKTFGVSDPSTAGMVTMLIEVNAVRGNWGKVSGLCKRVVPALSEALAFEREYAAASRLQATALLALGRPADGAAGARSAIDRLERRGTVGSGPLGALWAILGQCELAAGKTTRAEAAFTRARAHAFEAGDGALAAAMEQALGNLGRGARPTVKGVS